MRCCVRVATKESHTSSSAVPTLAGGPPALVAPPTVPVVPAQGEAGVRAWALAHRSLAGAVVKVIVGVGGEVAPPAQLLTADTV